MSNKETSTYSITKKLNAYSGNELMKFGKHWRLYTHEEKYGNEPIVKEKRINELLKGGHIKRIELERNLAINTVNHKYTFI